jgi:lysyl endopeptidase
MQATLGAFTANTSNKSSKQFATTPLTGDSLIIEYIAPAYVNQLPEISLSRVVYGYRRVPFLETSPDLYYPRNRHQQVYLKRRPRRHSGRCNIDLSCDSAGTEWIKEARSVAVLLTNENQMYCTGVLLNNAEQDGRQLLLTVMQWPPSYIYICIHVLY